MPTITEHNARLSKAGLPSVETLSRRILAVFDRATASDVESGATWYDAARELAVELAAQSGRTVEQTAAVIAHLSPRTSWARNVLGAQELVTHGTRANGVIGRNYDSAQRAMVLDDPESTFGGPKTRRFFRNIVGDSEAVTVDVWAARVADVDEALLSRVGVYDAVELAYQRAARRRGVAPSTMQATTWIVARGGRAS